MKEEEKIEKKGGLGGFFVKIFTYLIILAIGAGAVYFFAKTKPSLIGLPKNQSETQAEAATLVSQVGKLITLPSDETPTIATVTNIEQLKDQPFFKDAKNGDKVLVYSNANKAIIYRPDENRIINVGAVNVGTPVPSVSPTATPKGQKATPTPKPSESPVASPVATP